MMDHDAAEEVTPAEAEEPTEADTTPPGPKGGHDLTVGSIPRHLIRFSLPMLVGSVIQNAYMVINGMWVGKGLGETELAAVTATFPVFWMLIAAAIGLTMASNILVSQAYGAKDWAQVRRVTGNSVALVCSVSLVLLLAGQFACNALLRLVNTPPDVYDAAAGYFHIFLWTLPLSFLTFLLASFLRGAGDAVTPLWFQSVAVVLAAALDPVLMFGWLGAPALGLNGTAYASIIAQAGTVVGIVVHLHRKRHIVLPDLANIRFDRETTALTLRIGVPSMIQQSLLSVGSMVLAGIVNSFGVDTTAAYGAALRIEMLAMMPAMTIGMAASSLAGQNIGAHRYERVREVFGWSLIVGAGVTAVPALAAFFAPEFLLRGFLDAPTPVAIGVGYLRVVGLGYILTAVLFACNGVINGAGHTFATTLVTLVSLWFFRVPLAIYWARHLGRVEGVWYAIVVGFAIGMVLSLGYYLSGRWRRPVSGRRPRGAGSPLPMEDPVEETYLQSAEAPPGAP